MANKKVIVTEVSMEQVIDKINILRNVDKKNKKFYYTAELILNKRVYKEKIDLTYKTYLENLDDLENIDDFAQNCLVTEIVRKLQKGI
jgi:hypothetical protein